MTFSDWLTKRLNQTGMTQTRLAELTGFSQGRISDWKLGHVEPTLDRIEALCEHLGPYVLGAQGLDGADIADAVVEYRREEPDEANDCATCGKLVAAEMHRCVECIQRDGWRCPNCGRRHPRFLQANACCEPDLANEPEQDLEYEDEA